MKKVIVLSTVLGLSALGMACGDSASNNTANKPANNANAIIVPANTATPIPVATLPANNGNTSTSPSNSTHPSNTTAPSNTTKSNTTASPSPTKKP